jgi:hypothetical protein
MANGECGLPLDGRDCAPSDRIDHSADGGNERLNVTFEKKSAVR